MALGEELTHDQVLALGTTSDDARKVTEELLYLRAAIQMSRGNVAKLETENKQLMALLAMALYGLDDHWVTTDEGAGIVKAIERETGLTYA